MFAFQPRELNLDFIININPIADLKDLLLLAHSPRLHCFESSSPSQSSAFVLYNRTHPITRKAIMTRFAVPDSSSTSSCSTMDSASTVKPAKAANKDAKEDTRSSDTTTTEEQSLETEETAVGHLPSRLACRVLLTTLKTPTQTSVSQPQLALMTRASTDSTNMIQNNEERRVDL
jgi:hypothetical protein